MLSQLLEAHESVFERGTRHAERCSELALRRQRVAHLVASGDDVAFQMVDDPVDQTRAPERVRPPVGIGVKKGFDQERGILYSSDRVARPLYQMHSGCPS